MSRRGPRPYLNAVKARAGEIIALPAIELRKIIALVTRSSDDFFPVLGDQRGTLSVRSEKRFHRERVGTALGTSAGGSTTAEAQAKSGPGRNKPKTGRLSIKSINLEMPALCSVSHHPIRATKKWPLFLPQ